MARQIKIKGDAIPQTVKPYMILNYFIASEAPQPAPRATPRGAPAPVTSRAIGPNVHTRGLTTLNVAEAVPFNELIQRVDDDTSGSPPPILLIAFL